MKKHFDAWALDDLFGIERGEQYLYLDESQFIPHKRGEYLDPLNRAFIEAPRCPVMTPEMRRRMAEGISRAKMGHRHSEATKRKISESVSKLEPHEAFVAKQAPQYGEDNPFFGKKHSAESRKKMSERAKSRKAETVAQNLAKVKQVCELIEEGLTHKEACAKMKMNRNTFRSYLYRNA